MTCMYNWYVKRWNCHYSITFHVEYSQINFKIVWKLFISIVWWIFHIQFQCGMQELDYCTGIINEIEDDIIR